MVRKEYKEKLLKLINNYFPTAKVYLFGSQATGEYSKTSDIDIAVDDNKKADHYKITVIRSKIDDLNIPLDVDIVDFHFIPKQMKNRIEKEKLYGKNNRKI